MTSKQRNLLARWLNTQNEIRDLERDQDRFSSLMFESMDHVHFRVGEKRSEAEIYKGADGKPVCGSDYVMVRYPSGHVARIHIANIIDIHGEADE